MTQKAKSRRFSPSLDLHGTSVEGTEAPAALADLKMKARSVPTTVIRLDVWTPCGGSCMEAERSHGSRSIDDIGTDAITFDLGNPQDKDQCRLAHGFSCVRGCLQHPLFVSGSRLQSCIYLHEVFFSTSRFHSATISGRNRQGDAMTWYKRKLSHCFWGLCEELAQETWPSKMADHLILPSHAICLSCDPFRSIKQANKAWCFQAQFE